jgi:cytoskeletal protein CcmA (bactofilin family)
LSFAGGLHVDGLVRGDVGVRDGEGKNAFLTLSETGVIEGDVRVPNVVLSGRVVGDVVADDHVELKGSATVTGNVYYHLLEMSKGAEVNGELIHLDEEEQLPVIADLD